MELKIIHRKDLNNERWDALVASSKEVSFFSYTWYLDAIAENWCVISNDSYSIGVALPYTERMGQQILYTPIFVSYLELLGDKASADFNKCQELILANFKHIEVEFKESILGPNYEVFVSQLSDGTGKRKSQVNRMLNKARRFGLEVKRSSDWKSVFEIIRSELNNKFSGMSYTSLKRLADMYLQANNEGRLLSFEVSKDGVIQGGVICFIDEAQIFYSKGAVLEEARKNGGMYLAIDAAISSAREKELLFDFGGSRVEGVRRFNHNFGGEDFEYYSYRINNGLFWFKWLRAIKNKWFKKS